MAILTSPAASKIGIILTRVAVPIWVLTGAVFKLVESDISLLPKTIWATGNSLGVNLYWLLALLIALEFLAAGVMLMIARLAQLMAGFMLAAFCLILLNEIRVGNTSCGCLGAFSPSPWVMLAIDGALLLGVVLFKPRYAPGPLLPRGELIAAAVWIVSGFAVSAAIVLPEAGRSADGTDEHVEVPPDSGNGVTPLTAQPARPGRKPPPYVIPNPGDWVGQPWKSIEFAQFMKSWPADLDTGRRYVIFFSRSCDHCQEMLESYFIDEPPAPTLLVAIPETKQGFNRGGELDMFYCHECVTHADLPIGTEWLITAPLVVALENGTVACAREGGDDQHPPEECLIWHSATVGP